MGILQGSGPLGSGPLGSGPTGPGSGYSVMPLQTILLDPTNSRSLSEFE